MSDEREQSSREQARDQPFVGRDGPLAGMPRADWQGAAERSMERINRAQRREEARRVNEDLNVQEELAERERRIEEYDAAAAERAAARAARELAEARREADLARDSRRFKWQIGGVLTGVVLAAVSATFAGMAYFAPPARDPVVVPPPVVTVLPAPVVVAPSPATLQLPPIR